MQQLMTNPQRLIGSLAAVSLSLAMAGPLVCSPSVVQAENPGSTWDREIANPAEALSASFRQAVTVVQPSVVSITSEKELRVSRGSRGGSTLTPELAESFDFDGEDGVLFGDVTEGGPADKVKLKAGDIVTKINGTPMSSAGMLRNTVAATPPGTKIELEFFRDGRLRTLDVTLARLDDGTSVSASDESGAEASKLGLAVRTLTAELAQQMGIEADQRGVVVTEVEPGSLAEQAGLAPSDVIVSINGEATTDIGEFEKAIAKRDLEKGIRMQVMSDGLKRFLFLRSR